MTGTRTAARATGVDALEPSSFRSRTIRIHGHEVSYRMAGEGPAILLIHGIAGSSTTWRAVMPALAEHYTVIAPDLLGHGHSAKPGATTRWAPMPVASGICSPSWAMNA